MELGTDTMENIFFYLRMEHSDMSSESAEKTVDCQSQLFLEIPVNDSFTNKTDKCSTFRP